MPALEPTRELPLRWGRYGDRYVAGLALAIAGAVQVQGSNTYTVPLLMAGTVAVVVGWSILPARGWRRVVAVVLATAHIAALLAGPVTMWSFVLALLAWLIVRHRPLRSWVVLVLPLGGGFILSQFFDDYRWMPLCLAISMAVVVASAWIARAISFSVRGARAASG